MMMKKLALSVLLALVLLAAPGRAEAACASPPGDEGLVIYNATFHVMQFCDGTNWISMAGGNDTLKGLSCTSGQIAKWNGSTWNCAADAGGAPGAPANSVQFNDASAFGGSANLIFDKTANTNEGKLTVGSAGAITAGATVVDVLGKATANSMIMKSVAGLTAPGGGTSTWTASGGYLYRLTGNVGIGIAAPAAQFTVMQGASGATTGGIRICLLYTSPSPRD